MDNVNKIISFVLGLIVVVIVLLLVTGRLNIFKGGNFFAARGNTSTTPTPTKVGGQSTKTTPTPKRIAQNTAPTTQSGGNDQEEIGSGNIKTIPSTGAPTVVLVFSGIILIGGMYLRKFST